MFNDDLTFYRVSFLLYRAVLCRRSDCNSNTLAQQRTGT